MYTPHTITLILAEEQDDGSMAYNPVILSGVFLDLNKRSNVNRSGLADADSATLFIPFSVTATGADGNAKEYLSPKAYEAAETKSGYWTLFDGGRSGSAECYFVKGTLSDPAISYAEARDTYDYVYRVTSVDLRDFGRERMRHWQVGGK